MTGVISADNEDLLLRFSEGIIKFNNRDFYDCHDILEDVWFDVRGSSRRFYQGLIHLAVGFYHILEKDNPKGALSQLNKGITKLSNYLPEFQGVELKHLLLEVKDSIIDIEKIINGEKRIFQEKKIPNIIFDPKQFKNPN